MDRSELVIPRGTREEIRATEAPGGGLDVRVWFRSGDGTMRPGKEGLKLSRTEYEALIGLAGKRRAHLNARVPAISEKHTDGM